MGIYYAQGTSGQVYPIQIKGAQPSETERARITEYITGLGDQDADALIGGEDSSNALVRGFSRGIDTLQLGLGSALEGAGTVTGIDWMKEFGEDVVETNKQQLAEQEEYATRLDDVQDVGTGLSFFGETLGEQAPTLASTIGGSIVGAKTGAAIGTAIAPGVGTIIGTTVGTIGGALAANLPFFYGMNREAQKDTLKEGEVVDEGMAALTAIPQSALDFIADRVIVGRLINPKLINGGGILSRGVKGVGVGAAAEVPTEIGQQVLERLQAGKDITSDEAIKEYTEVAVAAGLIGGTVRGATNVVGGDPIKKEAAEAQRELDEDQSNEAHQVMSSAARGTNAVSENQEDPAVKKAIIDQRLSTEGSQLRQKREQEKTRSGLKPVEISTLSDEDQQKIRLNRQGLGVPQTDTVTIAELNDYGMASLGETIMREQLGAANSQATDKAATKKPFTQEQYNKAVDAVKSSGNASINSIAMALKGKGEKKNPALAKAILEEMTANRVVRTDDGIKFIPLLHLEVRLGK